MTPSKQMDLIDAERQRILVEFWYDFTFNNPRNSNVRGIKKAELKRLFPGLTGKIRSVTLAPPLARLVARRSWALATIFETIPLLRTHLLAVLIKAQ